MVNFKRIGLTGALLLLVCGLMTGDLSTVRESRAQATADWQSVMIVYNSDVVGKIEPCG